jgi:putative heme-binding domain-containing protein
MQLNGRPPQALSMRWPTSKHQGIGDGSLTSLRKQASAELLPGAGSLPRQFAFLWHAGLGGGGVVEEGVAVADDCLRNELLAVRRDAAVKADGGGDGHHLTHIAKIRNERDLLESIVFPSASIVRSYEPVAIATKDGKLFNGLIRRESPDEIVLATGANQEARIARDDIEYMRPSNISVMPAGLDQQLTPRDLADVVAFLKTCT